MDASLEDRCQTVIDFHKARAAGTAKMQAYTEVKGPFSVSSVRTWVNAEETAGVAALRCNRELCGARSKFSPGKQATLDELMEKTEGWSSTVGGQTIQVRWRPLSTV